MDDKTLITSLGGPAKVAELLGFDKARGGVQRVQNWMTRGIPPGIKVAFPHIFLREAFAAQSMKPIPQPICADQAGER